MKRKKNLFIIILIIILCIIGLFLTVISVYQLYISYVMNYKKTTCDTSLSPDGTYELILQAVGEPVWPYGPTSGQLVLKKGRNKISQTDFVLQNDGGSLSSDCWTVAWYEDYVEVILSASEQGNERYVLYFDGSE